jgi:hypothetical protein
VTERCLNLLLHGNCGSAYCCSQLTRLKFVVACNLLCFIFYVAEKCLNTSSINAMIHTSLACSRKKKTV